MGTSGDGTPTSVSSSIPSLPSALPLSHNSTTIYLTPAAFNPPATIALAGQPGGGPSGQNCAGLPSATGTATTTVLHSSQPLDFRTCFIPSLAAAQQKAAAENNDFGAAGAVALTFSAANGQLTTSPAPIVIQQQSATPASGGGIPSLTATQVQFQQLGVDANGLLRNHSVSTRNSPIMTRSQSRRSADKLAGACLLVVVRFSALALSYNGLVVVLRAYVGMSSLAVVQHVQWFGRGR